MSIDQLLTEDTRTSSGVAGAGVAANAGAFLELALRVRALPLELVDAVPELASLVYLARTAVDAAEQWAGAARTVDALENEWGRESTHVPEPVGKRADALARECIYKARTITRRIVQAKLDQDTEMVTFLAGQRVAWMHAARTAGGLFPEGSGQSSIIWTHERIEAEAVKIGLGAKASELRRSFAPEAQDDKPLSGVRYTPGEEN